MKTNTYQAKVTETSFQDPIDTPVKLIKALANNNIVYAALTGRTFLPKFCQNFLRRSVPKILSKLRKTGIIDMKMQENLVKLLQIDSIWNIVINLISWQTIWVLIKISFTRGNSSYKSLLDIISYIVIGGPELAMQILQDKEVHQIFTANSPEKNRLNNMFKGLYKKIAELYKVEINGSVATIFKALEAFYRFSYNYNEKPVNINESEVYYGKHKDTVEDLFKDYLQHIAEIENNVSLSDKVNLGKALYPIANTILDCFVKQGCFESILPYLSKLPGAIFEENDLIDLIKIFNKDAVNIILSLTGFDDIHAERSFVNSLRSLASLLENNSLELENILGKLLPPGHFAKEDVKNIYDLIKAISRIMPKWQENMQAGIYDCSRLEPPYHLVLCLSCDAEIREILHRENRPYFENIIEKLFAEVPLIEKLSAQIQTITNSKKFIQNITRLITVLSKTNEEENIYNSNTGELFYSTLLKKMFLDEDIIYAGTVYLELFLEINKEPLEYMQDNIENSIKSSIREDIRADKQAKEELQRLDEALKSFYKENLCDELENAAEAFDKLISCKQMLQQGQGDPKALYIAALRALEVYENACNRMSDTCPPQLRKHMLSFSYIEKVKRSLEVYNGLLDIQPNIESLLDIFPSIVKGARFFAKPDLTDKIASSLFKEKMTEVIEDDACIASNFFPNMTGMLEEVAGYVNISAFFSKVNQVTNLGKKAASYVKTAASSLAEDWVYSEIGKHLGINVKPYKAYINCFLTFWRCYKVQKGFSPSSMDDPVTLLKLFMPVIWNIGSIINIFRASDDSSQLKTRIARIIINDPKNFAKLCDSIDALCKIFMISDFITKEEAETLNNDLRQIIKYFQNCFALKDCKDRKVFIDSLESSIKIFLQGVSNISKFYKGSITKEAEVIYKTLLKDSSVYSSKRAFSNACKHYVDPQPSNPFFPAVQIVVNNLNMRGISLTGTLISHQDLEDVNLREAELQNCTLCAVNFINLDVAHATITKCSFNNNLFNNTYLKQLKLLKVNLNDTNFEIGNATKAMFKKVDIDKATFADINFQEAHFQKVKMQNVKFRECDFSNAVLENISCDVSCHHDTYSLMFESCIFDSTQFSGLEGEIVFHKCKFTSREQVIKLVQNSPRAKIILKECVDNNGPIRLPSTASVHRPILDMRFNSVRQNAI